MDKAPDAYRTISEVATDLELPQHVLRFWETRFTQIKPLKRGGSRRYYRPDDVDLVRGIKHLLHGTGYTIKGVQRILKEEGVKHVQIIGRTGQIPSKGAPAQEPAAERVLASPLKSKAQPAPSEPAKPGSAEDLAALIAPRPRSPSKAAQRSKAQLGLFGELPEATEDTSSAQAVARMLPQAWQGLSVSGQLAQRLQSVLAELEECGQLVATARLVATEGRHETSF